MASPAGNSSVSGTGSDGDLMDERKRKRMESNRESARRSRLRKQKHLDDLTAKAAELRNQNAQMLRTVGLTTESYIRTEVENSVLRARVAELTQSLNYLNGVLSAVSNNQHHYGGACTFESEEFHMGFSEGYFPGGGMWNSNGNGGGGSQQFPIMATAEMINE